RCSKGGAFLFNVRTEILFDENYARDTRCGQAGYGREIERIWGTGQSVIPMIILLSTEQPGGDEWAVVHGRFESGLPRSHIRRYRLTDTEMDGYVDGIDPAYRKQLVLHSHFHLAGELGIERLHIREVDRQQGNVQREAETGHFRLSTSVHSIAAFNSLEDRWDYACL